MKKLNKKGFTIVELVIVIAVIAILAAVMIPTFGGIIDKANESAALQQADAAYTNDLILLDGQAANYTEADYMKYEVATKYVSGETYYTKSNNVYKEATGLTKFEDGTTYYEYVSICEGKIKDYNATTGTYTYEVTVGEYTATYADGKWVIEKNS